MNIIKDVVHLESGWKTYASFHRGNCRVWWKSGKFKCLADCFITFNILIGSIPFESVSTKDLLHFRLQSLYQCYNNLVVCSDLELWEDHLSRQQ